MIKGVDWSVRSLLILVSDLDRSAQFYTDVLGLQQAFGIADAALLAVDETEIPMLVLRQVKGPGLGTGQESLRVRAGFFHIGSSTETDRVEGRLKAFSAFQDRLQIGEHGRDVIRGHDPDRLPLQFSNLEPPMDAAEYRTMMSYIYGADL